MSKAEQQRDIMMLSRFLSMIHRPRHQGPLLAWDVETKASAEAKSFRATLTIVPTKKKCTGGWAASIDDAKADAARAVVDDRRGVLRVSPRAVLSETLQLLLVRPLAAEDLDVDTSAKSDSGKALARLRLFPALQGENEKDQLPVVVHEGEAAERQEAVHNAARKALTYLLGALACYPLLKILQERAGLRSKQLGGGSRVLTFWNVAYSVTEEDLRAHFATFGEVSEFSWERNKKETNDKKEEAKDADGAEGEGESVKAKPKVPIGGGIVTFRTPLSAFAASRCLHGEDIGGCLLCVNRDEKMAKRTYNHVYLKDAKPQGREARVFFKNAPLDVAPIRILDKFKQVGPVASLSYWRDKTTGRFRAMGCLGYVHATDAKRALQELNDAHLAGSKLAVTEYQGGSADDSR